MNILINIAVLKTLSLLIKIVQNINIGMVTQESNNVLMSMDGVNNKKIIL